MSLQDSLKRFNQQQERCQMIAATAGSARAATTHKFTPSTLTKAPAPPVRFSDDTERLQHINIIRKSSAGAQIKRVIDLLLQTRKSFTLEQINKVCYVDVEANKTVFDSLRNNLKVHYNGVRFSYKPKHDLKDKNQLLVLVRKFPEGIAVTDLKDSYPTVMEDLQALKHAGQIWLLANFDSQEDIAYPNDPRVPIKVDDDLKQLFWGIKLPKDMLDIEADLQKNGMKPATKTAERSAAVPIQGISTKSKTKKKKHEITNRAKLTNAHLPWLFQNFK